MYVLWFVVSIQVVYTTESIAAFILNGFRVAIASTTKHLFVFVLRIISEMIIV